MNLSGPRVKDTPRSIRTDGGGHFITNLRHQISDEMDREFLIYDSDVFIAKYLPFVPTAADIRKCSSDMLQSDLMLDQEGLLRFKYFVDIPDRIDSSELPPRMLHTSTWLLLLIQSAGMKLFRRDAPATDIVIEIVQALPFSRTSLGIITKLMLVSPRMLKAQLQPHLVLQYLSNIS